ncbi:hypothetical protein DSECCO2_541330 [anaerobic digester metagenome]
MKEPIIVVCIHDEGDFSATCQCGCIDHHPKVIQFHADQILPFKVRKGRTLQDLHGIVVTEVVDQGIAYIGQRGSGILILIIREGCRSAGIDEALSGLKHQGVAHAAPIDLRSKGYSYRSKIIVDIVYATQALIRVRPIFHGLGHRQSV